MDKVDNSLDKIKNENKILLDRFEKYLTNKKLSRVSIDKHIGNADFFINDFLLYYEPITAKDGSSQVGCFLGDWFIRKAMWASVTSIKENITSLKKFYQFMFEIGEIPKDDLFELEEEIKECKDDWFENLRKYDDPDVDLEDIW
ncbi:MAG: recombinase [Desulfoprunum sp.]|jgi:hypothetical protein